MNYIYITGSGITDLNGRYNKTGGRASDESQYKNTHYIVERGTNNTTKTTIWVIYNKDDESDIYYACESESLTVPITGWTAYKDESVIQIATIPLSTNAIKFDMKSLIKPENNIVDVKVFDKYPIAAFYTIGH